MKLTDSLEELEEKLSEIKESVHVYRKMAEEMSSFFEGLNREVDELYFDVRQHNWDNTK